MEHLKADFGYIVRLETGEEIHNSIARFMKETGVEGGAISGIGALSAFSLGYYDLETKIYVRRDYEEEVELASCAGNLAYKGESPIAHLHAVLSNADMETLGGHLFRGVVSATAEFTISNAGRRMRRRDVTEGLPLLELGG